MATLYYGKVTAVGWTVTDFQAGFAPSNVSLESIKRPWKGLDAGAKDIVISFNVPTPVYALVLQDVNFASCSVLKSADGISFVSVGTLSSAADKSIGRRRGVIVVNDATVKALKISIGAGTPTDGLSYWRIGAAYPFASSSAFPRSFDYGVRIRAIYPKTRVELANKQIAQATTGQDILALSLPFKRASTQDPLELVRRGRLGTVALALDLTLYPELVLPVRHVEEDQDESFDFYNYSSLTMEVRESV